MRSISRAELPRTRPGSCRFSPFPATEAGDQWSPRQKYGRPADFVPPNDKATATGNRRRVKMQTAALCPISRAQRRYAMLLRGVRRRRPRRVRAVSVFQKIAVFEVVDLHRATHLAERFGGGRLGTGAARLQDLVDLLGAALPIGASLADRRELRLHDVAEELLNLDVTETAAAVMFFQRFEILVFREKLREMLVPRECVEVDEHRVPLGVTGILAASGR